MHTITVTLPLSLAINAYDHVRDLRPQGIDLLVLELPIEEIFFRFTKFREWQASEMSFGKAVSLMSEERPDIVAIPVFPSRVFRHSAIYLGRDSSIRKPKELEGKRVGIPEWAQTAGIYVRGMLQHEYGVDLAAIDWRQAGVREPGRIEKVELKLPKGVKIVALPERSLSEMLAAGDLDAGPGWREAVHRLSADRSGLFPQDAHLSHHARGGAAQARVRARSLDRHEPPQGLRGSEAQQPRAHRGDRRVAGSRALDRGAGPPLALARRRGFLALRRRAEPADAGSISAVFVRAGRGEEAPCARGSVRARDAGKLQDLVDLDAEVLDDLGVFLVVAADQRHEFIGRQHERLEPACVIEPLL